MARAQAAADVASKETNLDAKKQIDMVKAAFEKDQEKAAKKITKLTKRIEELTATNEEEKGEIAELTAKMKELQAANVLLNKQVEKFSGDAQELSKVRDLLVERTKILKETSREF